MMRSTSRQKTARGKKRGQSIWGRKKASPLRSAHAAKSSWRSQNAPRTRFEKWLVIGAAASVCLFFVSQSLVPAAQSWILGNGLALETIAVRGNHQVSAAEIAQWTELASGTPLAALDSAALETKLATHPRITQATVLRLFPSKLLIGVEERVGVITAQAPNQEVYVVDAAGIAFDRATASEVAKLPRVVSDQAIRLQDANPALVEGISLLTAAREQNLPEIVELSFTAAEGLSFRFHESAATVLVGHGEMRAKLEQMAKLAAVDLPETANATLIDLRFQDRAVLKTDATPSATSETSAQQAN